MDANTILCGNNVDVMRDHIDNQSIDMVVTSPPYDSLRDYHGHHTDIDGLCTEFDRIVKPGGVVAWVVADQIHNGYRSLSSMKQAIRFQENGWQMYDTIIYSKLGGLASRTPIAYRPNWEYIFVLCRGKPKTFNPITTRAKSPELSGRRTLQRTAAGAQVYGSKKRYHLTVFRNTVWTYDTGYRPSDDPLCRNHPAVMPKKLAADLIKSWTNPGDVVLDPFGGSGTTCVEAKRLRRSYIGIDMSPEYCDLMRKRVAKIQSTTLDAYNPNLDGYGGYK